MLKLEFTFATLTGNGKYGGLWRMKPDAIWNTVRDQSGSIVEFETSAEAEAAAARSLIGTLNREARKATGEGRAP